MKKSIWVSRHTPTPEQATDAATSGFEIVVTPEGVAIGSRSLETDGDVFSFVTSIRHLAEKHGCRAVHGVFSAPVLGYMYEGKDDNYAWLPAFVAWNVSRTPEGGKPTFTHKKWVWVGYI